MPNKNAFHKGEAVRLTRQESSHLTGRRHVKVGATGVILAIRQLPNDSGQQLLVKFKGHAGPRHTSASAVDRLVATPERQFGLKTVTGKSMTSSRFCLRKSDEFTIFIYRIQAGTI